MTKTIKHKVIRLNEDTKLYRGMKIRKTHIPAGYSGHYKVAGHWFTTQTQAKEHIDQECVKANVETFMTDERVKELIELHKD